MNVSCSAWPNGKNRHRGMRFSQWPCAEGEKRCEPLRMMNAKTTAEISTIKARKATTATLLVATKNRILRCERAQETEMFSHLRSGELAQK
jgi:hypothetical protein